METIQKDPIYLNNKQIQEYLIDECIENIKNLNYGYHHPTICLDEDYRMCIGGLATGCGLMQLFSFVNYFNNSFFDADIFLELLTSITDLSISMPCRTFICTLGSYYYNCSSYRNVEINLKKVGFTQIAEYYNSAHNGDEDFQRLYILNIS